MSEIKEPCLLRLKPDTGEEDGDILITAGIDGMVTAALGVGDGTVAAMAMVATEAATGGDLSLVDLSSVYISSGIRSRFNYESD